MMDTLIELLNTANQLSPVAVIGLLGGIIFLLVKGKTAADEKVETIATNHLHDLPSIAANMERTVEILQRLEVKISEEFSYIRAKLGNGQAHK